MDNIRGSVHTSAQPSVREPAPAPVNSGAPQHHQAPSPSRAKKPKSIRGITLAVVVAVLAIAAAFGFFFYRSLSAQPIDTNKYQAVFFTNGQVYFGKLEQLDGGYMKLTKVFYLQTKNDTASEQTDSKNPQKTTTSTGDVQLIKLGDEVHGPVDEMVINKEQVLFYENLKGDSKVSKSIDEYLNKK